MAPVYDFIVIGSGFGGSVSALRLVEKGYRVVLLEKGSNKRAEDFPTSNWDFKRWIWRPGLGWRGIFNMTFLRHVTVLSGVGVGGGSLVYANTLPRPKAGFFDAPSWSHLASWRTELEPHYRTAERMLGATENRIVSYADEVVRELGRELGREQRFELSRVGVYFGEPGKPVRDPFFGGEGPDRVGCNGCGGCMIGCRYGAKNTLDLNYLYLAQRRGLKLEADTEATAVRPADDGGYLVESRQGVSKLTWRNARRVYRGRQVVFAGGVLGTVPLLLRLRADARGLPYLSERVGDYVRTNSEVLSGVVRLESDPDMSLGIAIGSILHTDEHSHLEPVRYPAGSDFFRLLVLPHASGNTVMRRLVQTLKEIARRPWSQLRATVVRDWARRTMILLYMRTQEAHLSLRLGRRFGRGIRTTLSEGPAPQAFIADADDLIRRVERLTGGVARSMMTETLRGAPTTAHVLGGACMGNSATEGVIDARHRVFGYDGLYVADGSAVSANPGVNPALTITAMAERAMSLIPANNSGS